MPRKLVFRDLSEFRRLYWENLWPEARIARYLKVSRTVVRRLIRENGLLPRDHWASNRFLAEERSEAERRAVQQGRARGSAKASPVMVNRNDHSGSVLR
jgi:hypothetical protein